MGRRTNAYLLVRGRDCSALSYEKMVFSEGLGDETCQADWHEKGESGHCTQDCRDPSLHLGRWDFVRVGGDEGGLNVNS